MVDELLILSPVRVENSSEISVRRKAANLFILLSGYVGQGSMKTLFLAWGLHRSDISIGSGCAHWFPIERLDGEPERSWFRFVYTRGVLAAQTEIGFQSLEAFPRLGEAHRRKGF